MQAYLMQMSSWGTHHKEVAWRGGQSLQSWQAVRDSQQEPLEEAYPCPHPDFGLWPQTCENRSLLFQAPGTFCDRLLHLSQKVPTPLSHKESRPISCSALLLLVLQPTRRHQAFPTAAWYLAVWIDGGLFISPDDVGITPHLLPLPARWHRMHACRLSHSVVSNSLQPHGL